MSITKEEIDRIEHRWLGFELCLNNTEAGKLIAAARLSIEQAEELNRRRASWN